MALLLAITLWLLLAMLFLVGVALMTPVFVRVHLSTSPHFAYRVEMRALAGLAPRLTLAEGSRKGSGAKPNPEPDPEPAKPKQRRVPRLERVHGSVVRAVPSLILGLLHRIHLKELHIDADYGLGDPADTGQLCGLLMPLQYASPMPASVSLDLRPDFTRAILNGSVTAVVRVTLASLFVPLSRFAWRAFGPGR